MLITDREKQYLESFIKTKSIKESSIELGVCTSSVSGGLFRILRKFGYSCVKFRQKEAYEVLCKLYKNYSDDDELLKIRDICARIKDLKTIRDKAISEIDSLNRELNLLKLRSGIKRRGNQDINSVNYVKRKI